MFEPEPAKPAPKPAAPPEEKPAEPAGEAKEKEGVGVAWQAISPDGKWVVMIAGAEEQQNLYAYSLDELARERPVARRLTSTAAGKSGVQITPDSKEVFYLRSTPRTSRARRRPMTCAASSR